MKSYSSNELPPQDVSCVPFILLSVINLASFKNRTNLLVK